MPGIRQREGLVAKVRQIRIAGTTGEDHSPESTEAVTLHNLEQRIAHLEQQLRGLQDSVHRENVRHTSQIADLAARMEPAALAVALETDARERGL
ncbi:MAG TPA: hypothetical protein VG294_04040 [Solirubrobacteraceae bacterium]|nr:hypothetical protein [Solirubrobacteraceae bacterium]